MKKRDNVLEDYMTVSEARAELGVARSTFYRLLEKFGIEPLKAANASLFTREDIERLKQERE